MPELSSEATAELKTAAESGNPEAKQILSELSQTVPADKGTVGDNQKSGVKDGSEEDLSQVEKPHERNGRSEYRPTKLDTIRELRQKKRELERVLHERDTAYSQRLEELETKLKSLDRTGQPPATDEDILAKFLSKPNEFLEDRDKRVLQEISRLLDQKLQEMPTVLKRQQESSEALKMLENTENFDIDQDEDELYEILDSDYGIDEDILEDMLRRNPMKMAGFIVKVWEKRNNLSPETMKSKKVAASGVAGGKVPSGGKPSMKDIDERARQASLRGDSEEIKKILAEVDGLLRSGNLE